MFPSGCGYQASMSRNPEFVFKVVSIVSSRFPSLFPTLQPDFVAKEVVAGTLRNEPIVILPRSVLVNFALLG